MSLNGMDRVEAPGDEEAMPPSPLLAEARGLLPGIVAVRREIHRTPEVGIHLPRTQQTVLRALAGLGLTVSVGERLSSVVAVLEGAAPGRTVLLRADMDALPQQEDTALEFASQSEGFMHACGHDTHMAMLVGAARLLAARRQRLAGRVVFMFQPGEELSGGAQLMLEEGVLGDAEDSPKVDGAFALHVAARYEAGTVHLRPGPQFAAADFVRVTVRGRAGHAAAPHKVLDPVPVACEIVQALQTMMTRTVSVFDPAVLTIASVTAGSTFHVVPETAELHGTYRTFTDASRQVVRDGIVRVAHGVAAAHGAVADVELVDGSPALHNDPLFTAGAHRAAATVVGPGRVHEMPHPTMGGEDFSYVLRRVPGAMAFLGACPPGRSPATAPDNHSNRVVYDESVMAIGAAVHTAVAEAFLAVPATEARLFGEGADGSA